MLIRKPEITNEDCKNIVENNVLCCISGLAEECFNKDIFKYEEIENLYDEKCGDDQEIFEYWLVTKFLYDKLKNAGQPVYNYNDFNYIWGRTTTGQLICMDFVIGDICKNIDAANK